MPTSQELMCRRCGTALRSGARFCDSCGASTDAPEPAAEFKQVTVLIADVVRSMDVAAALGAERLREIMSELFDQCAIIVQRLGGTVDKFTGDGVMVLFGAPEALEDHAFRACLAALEIQQQTHRLAAAVALRDGVNLYMRVGLNSGRVVIGEIGSSSLNYTAIGEQVGMAQRMQEMAPPGGVMLSASTARLVADRTILSETELVHIKGSPDPVAAHQLLAIAASSSPASTEATLIGRDSEISELAQMLDAAVCGNGAAVAVVGPPGIGKSRLVREAEAMARRRSVPAFVTVCQSHTQDVAFHAISGLLRTICGVEDLDAREARVRVRAELPGTDEQDLLLLEDLLGIRDTNAEPPPMDPDARRRRLWRLLTSDVIRRSTQGIYIVEDTHWIDAASDSMLAELVAILRRTHSLVLITYRPEYHGALTALSGCKLIRIARLTDSQSSALVRELLGPHPSVANLSEQIAERAAGNPFFAEEIVRDLAARGVLHGTRGAYESDTLPAEVTVPATIEATLSSRIDRLSATAKRTANAAAVIGSRFDLALLTSVYPDAALTELVAAELIDRVTSSPREEYAFRHPMIRSVAYESQLKSDRSRLHLRVAQALERQSSTQPDEQAALIASHAETGGELRAAFDWHMRAANWMAYRDISAARTSWRRARDVADRLPATDPEHTALRIAPRTLLCATAWRVGGSVVETGFDELRVLTTSVGDKRSLVTAMSGLLLTMTFHAQLREASELATDYVDLLESIGDDALTVGLLHGAFMAKWQAGEMLAVLRLAQRVIDLSAGDPAMGNMIVGSPMAIAIAARGAARSALGQAGWKDDFDTAIALARTIDPFSRVLTVMFKTLSVGNGVLLADETILRDTAEILDLAEKSGDNLTLANAQVARGIALIQLDDAVARQRGFDLFELVRQAALQERVTICAVWYFDIAVAREKMRTGDLDSAIELARTVVENEFRSGEMIYRGWATEVLVEGLIARGANGDLCDAQSAIDRLTAVPTDPGFVLNEVPLLKMRALMARARGQQSAWSEAVTRYRNAARSCGFAGHLTSANALIWADQTTY